MRRFLIYISNSHEAILKAFIVLITIGVIAAMLPHKVRYKFDIQKGKAWSNEDLVAPLDFAIFKDPDSLKAEKITAVMKVYPHFQMDTSILFNFITDFQRRIERDSHSVSEKEKLSSVGITLMSEIFSKGIIRISDSEPVGPGSRLVLVKGKVTYDKSLDEFFNPVSAGTFLEKQLNQLLPGNSVYLFNILSNYITPNVFYDNRLTDLVKEQKEKEILTTRGMVAKGDLIIARGQIVSHEKYLVLESLKKVTESAHPDRKTTRDIYWGQILIVSISISVLLIFLSLLRKDIYSDNRKLALIFSLILLMVAAYTGTMKTPTISLYIVPICVLPVVIRVFFDTRLALFTHVVTVLILASVAPNGYEFIFMQIIAGMIAIFSITNLRKRAHLFIAAGMIFISYFICYVALSMIHEGSFLNIDYTNLIWLLGNVLLTLFSYPLIFIFEKVFGLTSDISLMELSDTNSELLRELSLKAPGTFQHSMQVANLAEAATYKIGGNTMLVRVGALYHDVGKMDMPLYFIENQSTGINPHDDLSFDESAAIIISHVIKGIEKARKYKLPDLVIDFIRTHHGTSMVQYFYQSFLKNFPEKLVDEDDFKYPGPLPFSKETAVLMMADSVEASSRSLVAPNADSINKLVDQIIDSQIEQQQFVNCDITFRDISSIKKIFKKMLMSMYHVRVEYPRR